MWTKQILKQTETATRFRILQNSQPLDFQTVFNLWATSADKTAENPKAPNRF